MWIMALSGVDNTVFLEGRIQYVGKMAAASSVDDLSLESLANTGCRAHSMLESIRSQCI